MSKIAQLHRMTTAQASLYTGPAGEIIVDTGAYRLRVQDGVTPGGYAACVASLNLTDLLDVNAARVNIGAAPLANPNFTGGAQVAGDTVATLTAAQILTNKQLNSPTMITPVLGTPGSGNLANCTGYPVSTDGTFVITDQSGAGLVFTLLRAAYTKIGTRYFVDLSFVFPATANGAAALIGLGALPAFANVNGVGGSWFIYAGLTPVTIGIANLNTNTFVVTNTVGTPVTNATLSATTLRMQFQLPTV